MPVIMLFFFGVLEMGLLYKDYLGAANAVRESSRTGTTAGNEVSADYQLLQRFLRSADALPKDGILRIIVFKASGPGDTPSAACLAASPSTGVEDECNTYILADALRPVADFGTCTKAAATRLPDTWWCPSDRETAVTGPPDYIGVWVELEHPMVTGLFGDTVTLDDQAILRLEPQAL